MSKRRLLLHIGTHKSGTTSIQAFLAQNAGLLLQRGILIPRSGRPVARMRSEYIGHHNIPWELLMDPRFEVANGTLDDLLDEICNSPATTIIVSSEDFEYLYERSDLLEPLAERFRRRGIEAEIIVYLRAQARYAQSLYIELLRHGLMASFDDYYETILEHGRFELQNHVRFQFQYSRLLQPFTKYFPDKIHVRRYPENSPGEELLRDLLSVIDPSLAAAYGEMKAPQRLNPSSRFIEVLDLLYGSYVRRAPSSSKEWPPGPCSLILQKFPTAGEAVFNSRVQLMTEREYAAMSARFAKDNAIVSQQYNVDLMKWSSDTVDAPLAEAQRGLLSIARDAWEISASVGSSP